MPSFMLCTPKGKARWAASPASQIRPRPNEAASERSKRTATDHIRRPVGSGCQGSRSAPSSCSFRSSSVLASHGTIDGTRLLPRAAVATSSSGSSNPSRVRSPRSGHQMLAARRRVRPVELPEVETRLPIRFVNDLDATMPVAHQGERRGETDRAGPHHQSVDRPLQGHDQTAFLVCARSSDSRSRMCLRAYRSAVGAPRPLAREGACLWAWF